MDDLENLRSVLDIKKGKHSHDISIKDMEDLIDTCGYTCERTRKKRKKCVIIHKD